MLGDRIKSARLALGMSLRELAEKVGVSHSAIQKYEKGMDIPGSGVLLKLAEVLDVSVEYFFRQNTVLFSEPSFRKRHEFGKKKQYSALAKAKEFLEKYIFIESLLPSERREFKMPKSVAKYVKRLDDLEDVAIDLRNEWNLGLDPIKSFVEGIESHGIKVVLLDILDKAFDGFSAWMNDDTPVIGISKSENWPGDRQRYTIAHELGHILIQRFSPELKEEKIANRFAGAFLLPKDIVFEELGKNRSSFSLSELHGLKIKYGASMQSWLIRARDLDIISDSRYISMIKYFRRNNWHIKEPLDQIPPENPNRMERLVYRSLIEDLISESKAAGLLNKSIMEIREIIRPIRWGQMSVEVGR